LILREVRMTANKVAVKVTVPSGLSGMFMATKRCNTVAAEWNNTFVKGAGQCLELPIQGWTFVPRVRSVLDINEFIGVLIK
jgi:hypothetical protein